MEISSLFWNVVICIIPLASLGLVCIDFIVDLGVRKFVFIVSVIAQVIAFMAIYNSMPDVKKEQIEQLQTRIDNSEFLERKAGALLACLVDGNIDTCSTVAKSYVMYKEAYKGMYNLSD